MTLNRKRIFLLVRLHALRVLETTFTTIRGERKTHYLLTTTPRKKSSVPDEEDQLGGARTRKLIDDIIDVLNRYGASDGDSPSISTKGKRNRIVSQSEHVTVVKNLTVGGLIKLLSPLPKGLLVKSCEFDEGDSRVIRISICDPHAATHSCPKSRPYVVIEGFHS